MLRIRLSITLFNKRKTCELTKKDAVYILESLRKVPDNKGSKRPFVCVTGYNGMVIHILEGSFEELPPYMILKQGIAYNGSDKNICWPILNKSLETEQIAVFAENFLNYDEKALPVKHFYQDTTITQQNLFTPYPYSLSSSYSESPANLIPAPVYEPEVWNNDINILINNNCYTYALNIKGFRRSCGKDPNKTAFGNIIKNCVSDNLHIVSTVTNNSHLIALFASSPFSDVSKTRTDYHFFRRDANGEWSHKNGHSNVTNRDFSGRIIKDVMACDRGRFQYFFGLFNVTANTIEKVAKRM